MFYVTHIYKEQIKSERRVQKNIHKVEAEGRNPVPGSLAEETTEQKAEGSNIYWYDNYK
jgi:hypothetical protein